MGATNFSKSAALRLGGAAGGGAGVAAGTGSGAGAAELWYVADDPSAAQAVNEQLNRNDRQVVFIMGIGLNPYRTQTATGPLLDHTASYRIRQ